jgi:hypothetical protein
MIEPCDAPMSPQISRKARAAKAATSDQPAAEESGTADFQGYLGAVAAGAAIGWCWKAAEPETKVEVEVVVDGKPVARGVADRRRDDLVRAGYGDGHYGFRIPLPRDLDDGETHRIVIRVGDATLPAAKQFRSEGPKGGPTRGGRRQARRWARTRFVPEGAPTEVAATSETLPVRIQSKLPAPVDRPVPVAVTPARKPARKGALRRRRPELDAGELTAVAGFIDGVAGGEILGWVADPEHPQRTVRVEAFFDGEKVGEVDADVSRAVPKRRGFGERHGFRVPLRRHLEPGVHSVAVRTVIGGLRVPLSPDYVVQARGQRPIEGVTLLEAMSGEPPPGPGPGREALLGLDGWIFEFADPDFHILRGAAALDDRALASHLVRIHERHQLAHSIGATLFVAVIPSRLATYSEYLPPGVDVYEANRPINRLLAVVREENEIDVSDLTPPLRQAKEHGDVFARTGRELTWLGAFAAYRAVAKEIARTGARIVPLQRRDLTFGELELSSDSLAELPRRVWVGTSTIPAGTAAEDEEHEGQPRLDTEGLASEYAVLDRDLAAVAGPEAAMLQRRQPRGGNPALVIHDGTAGRVALFLAEHFDRTVVVASGADVHRVAAQLKPTVIVELCSEVALLRA